MDPNQPSTSTGITEKRKRSTLFTLSEVIESVQISDDEDLLDQDYPVEDLTDEEDIDFHPESRSRSRSSSSDSDNDQLISPAGDSATPPPAKQQKTNRPRPRSRTNQGNRGPTHLGEGWTHNYNAVNTDFLVGGETGPRNIPANVTAESHPLDYFSLFMQDDIWDLLCTQTNRRASQDKEIHPMAIIVRIFLLCQLRK